MQKDSSFLFCIVFARYVFKFYSLLKNIGRICQDIRFFIVIFIADFQLFIEKEKAVGDGLCPKRTLKYSKQL